MICLWVFYHHHLHYFSLVLSRISRIHMLFCYDLGIFLFGFILLLLQHHLLMFQLLFQLPPHHGVFLLCVSSLLFSLPCSFVAFLGVVCGSLMQFLPFFWFLFV